MATRLQDSSLTVRDVIKKSKFISEGPPARYRLLTTRSNLYEKVLMRKWTFGKRDVKMQNKILLLVGETGTGKTTVINAMVNYILKVKFIDEVWFEITDEKGDNQMSDQSKSKTTEITMYEIFIQDNPICLTIIDTPGYGDARGTEYDKEITENLYTLFHNDTGVKEIDAVCLVVKASVNRFSNRQQYIFDAVLSVFGKDIEDNIVIFVTHSDGLPPDNSLNAIKKAGVLCRKNEENEPEHFLFNNRQAEKRNPRYNRVLQTAWELTEDSLNVFFASLEEENRKSLEQTESVMKESKQLKACMSNLKDRIDFVERKREELSQIQKALEENQEKIKRNENFTFTVTKCYKEKLSIENASWWDRKATTCSVCKENCHEYNCWCAWSPWWCEVMKNNDCTSCTGKCHYTKHVKEDKKYVACSEQTTVRFDDFKKQYESSNSASDITFDSKAVENVKKEFESSKKQEEEKTSMEKRLKEELTKNEKEKADLVEEACTIIMKLSEIALKPDSAFIVQCLDFLIPRAEEPGKLNYAQRLRELRNIQPESQERVNAVMGYARAGFS
ncbi:uncharacterized protein LOC128610737 [Ictalurus furcatus]|uniref:uncharacterized protein LOC128610737 n=1 Tax=Ictalurus furcatus TaxID=66913 RepID=UPI00234FDF9F|nr:uncharacterized protein LOC128610737 [Ictalurus furcatus]